MKKLNPHSVGLAVGTVGGLWHLCWGVLVALGYGQLFLDTIYWLHFLNSPFIVGGFELTRSLMLIGVSFGFGYLMGWVFTKVWNRN